MKINLLCVVKFEWKFHQRSEKFEFICIPISLLCVITPEVVDNKILNSPIWFLFQSWSFDLEVWFDHTI